MQKKPRIFIGSSVESLPIADAINANLDHEFEVTLWRNGFDLSTNTVDSLLAKALSVDFAVFIFSPDDLSTIREQQSKVVRDNVIFELGLFIGTIGKERCYIVKPRNTELHFPTDLLGLTTADYEPNRSDQDLSSALNFACTQIKLAAKKNGLAQKSQTLIRKEGRKAVSRPLNSLDGEVLKQLITTVTSEPYGVALWSIKQKLGESGCAVDISAINLERQGLIQKENDFHDNGEEYYSYKITQDGVDYVLESELDSERSNIVESSSNDLPF